MPSEMVSLRLKLQFEGKVGNCACNCACICSKTETRWCDQADGRWRCWERNTTCSARLTLYLKRRAGRLLLLALRNQSQPRKVMEHSDGAHCYVVIMRSASPASLLRSPDAAAHAAPPAPNTTKEPHEPAGLGPAGLSSQPDALTHHMPRNTPCRLPHILLRHRISRQVWVRQGLAASLLRSPYAAEHAAPLAPHLHGRPEACLSCAPLICADQLGAAAQPRQLGRLRK